MFAPVLTKVSLCPNPAFVSKVVDLAYRCPSTKLADFHLPPFSSPEEQKLNYVRGRLFIYSIYVKYMTRYTKIYVSWAIPQKYSSYWIIVTINVLLIQ